MGFILKQNTNYIDVSNYGLTILLEPEFFITPTQYQKENIIDDIISDILDKVDEVTKLNRNPIPSYIFERVGTYLFESRRKEDQILGNEIDEEYFE